MTRLFLEDQGTGSGFITLGPEDSHYLSQVLRMKAGEKLTAVISGGTEALCEVDTVAKSNVTLKILNTSVNMSEPPYGITLYQSVSKGERMELTIQKCVELGVTKIVPVFSMRCVVRRDEPKKQLSKTQRWQKIALEAARQSGRGVIPEVADPLNFNEALDASGSADAVLFPWEEEHGVTLKETLSHIDRNTVKEIAVFIGPEGGYDEQEAALAKEAGAVPVTLGKRILRTETAGASVLAMLLYEFEL